MNFLINVVSDAVLEMSVAILILGVSIAFSRVIWYKVVKLWCYLTISPNESNHNKLMGEIKKTQAAQSKLEQVIDSNTGAIQKIEETLKCIIKELKQRR